MAAGGLVLLLVLLALGVMGVLGAVVLLAIRAKLREDRAASGGAEVPPSPEQSGTPGTAVHKPALVGWLTCSGVLAVVVLAVAALWLRGCQAVGEAKRNAEESARCRAVLDGQIAFFGSYWDEHRKFPGPEEMPVLSCGAGCPFVYVGHRKVNWRGRRVLLVETLPHRDGSRRLLAVEAALVDGGKTVAELSGDGDGSTSIWRYRQYFGTRELEEAEYRRLAAEIAAIRGEDAP